VGFVLCMITEHMSKLKIGIIGFGQMGQFMAKHLSRDHDVMVSDVVDMGDEAERLGFSFESTEKVAQSDLVMLFVPIAAMEETCERIKDHLKPGSIVMDGCSVKVNPGKVMEKVLPKYVELLGCHPLFGPQSGRDGIKGLQIVLCDIRCSRIVEVRKIFTDLDLIVVEMSAEEHDRQMAKTQALELFLGRILIKMGAAAGKISTPGFDKLLEVKQMLEEDSDELFFSIQRENPFAQDIRDQVKKEMMRIDGEIK